jgi:hypothetical protein
VTQPEEHLGPIEIVAFHLPADMSPEPWHQLHAAVDAGLLRVLDLEFLHRLGEDEAELLDAADLPEAVGFAVPGFDDSATGLLADDDVIGMLADVEIGDVVAVVFVEHLSMLPVIAAFELRGARTLVEGPVDADELARVIDQGQEP